eukprot:XP_001694976.1 predicted protein [Chlamydomonas reinhardtii]
MLGRLEKAASQDDKVSELLLANADGARLVGAVERALALRAGELFAELGCGPDQARAEAARAAGNGLFQKGQWAAAVAAYTARGALADARCAAAADPAFAKAHYRAACALRLLGDLPAAAAEPWRRRSQQQQQQKQNAAAGANGGTSEVVLRCWHCTAPLCVSAAEVTAATATAAAANISTQQRHSGGAEPPACLPYPSTAATYRAACRTSLQRWQRQRLSTPPPQPPPADAPSSALPVTSTSGTSTGHGRGGAAESRRRRWLTGGVTESGAEPPAPEAADVYAMMWAVAVNGMAVLLALVETGRLGRCTGREREQRTYAGQTCRRFRRGLQLAGKAPRQARQAALQDQCGGVRRTAPGLTACSAVSNPAQLNAAGCRGLCGCIRRQLLRLRQDGRG